jgi:hypothetical protein
MHRLQRRVRVRAHPVLRLPPDHQEQEEEEQQQHLQLREQAQCSSARSPPPPPPPLAAPPPRLLAAPQRPDLPRGHLARRPEVTHPSSSECMAPAPLRFRPRCRCRTGRSWRPAGRWPLGERRHVRCCPLRGRRGVCRVRLWAPERRLVGQWALGWPRGRVRTGQSPRAESAPSRLPLVAAAVCGCAPAVGLSVRGTELAGAVWGGWCRCAGHSRLKELARAAAAAAAAAAPLPPAPAPAVQP